MKTNTPLTLTTPTATYSIFVGPDLLQTLPEHLDTLGLRGALWLISDTAVYSFYGSMLEERLRGAGYTIQSYAVPSGEASKSLDTASQLFDWLIGSGVERRDVVLALGGGVVGDLAGFAAAAVLRGIALVQLPTTLLAMVDSAIGGKTGVNHPLGKNLIGAFHQPRLVLSDTATLASLPLRELRAGWAEVIKHGIIRDAGLFEQLEMHARDLQSLASKDPQHQILVSDIIRRAAAVKVAVVSADERESGERMILNYGHTLGHALEVITGYGTLLHGEAVAIGMQLAARIAQQMGLIDEGVVERQQRLLNVYGLSTALPEGVEPGHLLELTLHDKKVRAGRVRWILPTAIGAAIICDDVPESLVRAVVETHPSV